MERPRVVVTGLGVVSSIGIGWQAFWDSLLASRSGVSEVTSFDTTDFPVHRGGEVREFHPEEFISPVRLKRYNRASQFAIAAAKMAIADANLDLSIIPPQRIGVAIGTTMAEAQAIEAMDSEWLDHDHNESQIHSRLIPQYPANVIGAHVALELGCYGPNMLLATACAAGNYALAYAFDSLQLGKTDVMLAGGADAFSRIAFMGFNRLFAMAPERCQPFDKNRKGIMLGEGCGILILERYESAIARQAPIYAEILGYGMSCDASHMTIPSLEGVKQVMVNALNNADLSPSDVDYINAHGTGTPMNDWTECAAIQAVFGSEASAPAVSSTKSMIGHAMGAASALEAVACVLAVRYDHLPPTINFDEPDPQCKIDCVPNNSRRHVVKIALNNSFAFGGNNACLVVRKHA